MTNEKTNSTSNKLKMTMKQTIDEKPKKNVENKNNSVKLIMAAREP